MGKTGRWNKRPQETSGSNGPLIKKKQAWACGLGDKLVQRFKKRENLSSPSKSSGIPDGKKQKHQRGTSQNSERKAKGGVQTMKCDLAPVDCSYGKMKRRERQLNTLPAKNKPLAQKGKNQQNDVAAAVRMPGRNNRKNTKPC